MNKKLVALAVAGAFALPLAAQAQTANVTLYGRANVDLEFVRGAQAASVDNGIAAGDNPTVVRVSQQHVALRPSRPGKPGWRAARGLPARIERKLGHRQLLELGPGQP